MFKRKVAVSTEGRAAIRRLLQNLTFELIPLSNVLAQAEFLPAGARVSVTASPAKGMQATVDLSLDLVQRGFQVVPHISARLTQDRAELEGILKQLSDGEISEAFIVGGDSEEAGEFFDGLSLLQAMDEIGHDMKIGIPSYPEGHHFISADAMDQALTDKQRYASSMTTQMCFTPSAIVEWIARQRTRGITLPVSIGIPGVAELRKLIGISARIGVGDSLRFLTKNTGLVGKLVRPGGYSPDDLIIGLADALADPYANIVDLHCYTFNQVETTEVWRLEMLESIAT
jgi:methylenetetrahydrofolate reductase (NADPH)